MRSANIAIAEIDSIEVECLQLLAALDEFSPPDVHGSRPATFRLVALPLLYSVWERAFRISTSIALRTLIEQAPVVESLPETQQALLLQKESFFISYTDKLGNQRRGNSSKGPGKGEFELLEEVLKEISTWRRRNPKLNDDIETYVMTFSNVNESVLRLHERILGSGGTIQRGTEEGLDISPLGELLGRRNDISHGGSMTPPGDRHFNELFQFTKLLIQSYCDTMRRAILPERGVGRHYTRLRGSSTPPINVRRALRKSRIASAKATHERS
jgi:hypothetical protein